MVDFSMTGPNAAMAAMDGFTSAQDRLELLKQQAIDNAMAEAQGIRAQQALDLQAKRMTFEEEQAAAAAERNATVYGQQDLLFAQQQEDRAKALADEEAAKARALEAQAGLVVLHDKIVDGSITARDFAAFTTQFPEMSEGLKGSWDSLSQEKQATTLSLAYRSAAAIKAGNPDLAIKMLTEYGDAAEASKNMEEANLADGLAATIKADPDQGIVALGLLIQGVDPEANTELFGGEDLTVDQDNYKFYEQQELDAGRKPLSFNEWSNQVKPADESTADQKNYKFYEAQEIAAGRKPKSFEDWQLKNNQALGGVTGDDATKDGQVYSSMEESAAAARAAEAGLRSLKEAEKALTGDAGAITGFAADKRLALAKLGALFGVVDPKIIENTETFRSAIAPQVAAMLKATVGSVQVSNADRDFAEKAAGGQINLDETSIKRLLSIMETASNEVIRMHNERLDAVYPPGTAERERAMFAVGGNKSWSYDKTGKRIP